MTAVETRPSFPFYGRDWYSSKRVRVLTPIQRLIYLALLWSQWESHGVPDEEQELDLIAASEGGTIDDVRRVLKLCFTLRDGRWVNGKLGKIRDELDEHRAKQRANGANGGRARAEGLRSDPQGSLGDPQANPTSASASASASDLAEEKNPQIPSGSPPPAGAGDSPPAAKPPEPEKPPSKPPKVRAKPADPEPLLALAENADLAPCAASFRAWAMHKRSKFTPIVADNTLARARELGPERFAAAVQFSIASSYQGLIEPPYATRNGRPPDPPKTAEQLAQEREDFEGAKRMFGVGGAA